MTMPECQKYRKKPAVIEARQFNGPSNAVSIVRWIGETGRVGGRAKTGDLVCIDTLEGTMRAVPGDWIIKGVKGEFYPCKPDVFEATYEPALSTITPAEAGGLWVPANPEHAKLGWSYDFEQTERIARAAYDSTGYEATMEVVEFVMAEAGRRHATALAAKDAELAEAWQRYVDANEARIDAEAQLAEANKALEEIENVQFPGWEAQTAVDHCRSLARRAREAQGGER